VAAAGVAGHDGAKDEAFDALFFAHAGRLVRLARLLGDDDPEDVVQESFCKLYAARSRLRDEDDRNVAYLNRIVVNEARSRHRRRTTARRDSHLLREEQDQRDPLERLGDRSVVVDALGQLPQRQREALVLRFWGDLPLHDVADVMGVRLGTAKSQVSRGLDAMEALLREEREEVER
jgi:RNA polymerase sigma factor (sigma-70 family)